MRKQKYLFVWAVLIPTISFYLIFCYFPIIYGAFLSFYDWKLGSPQNPFIGLGNFVKAFNNSTFRISLWNTLYFAFLSIPIELVLSMGISLLLNRIKVGLSLFRGIYFVPALTSAVAAVILWKWLYQPSYGLFNQILEMMGLPTLRWLNSGSLALPSIMIMTIWMGMGYTILILLAGLSGIPDIYYEAAKLDGASWWKLFRRITLPLLQPTMLFLLVVGAIGKLQVFTQVYLMTQGGPADSSRVLVLYIFDNGFHYLKMGYASAVAFILFGVILILTLIQLRALRVRWEY